MSHEEIVKQVKDIIVDKLGAEESEVTETANFPRHCWASYGVWKNIRNQDSDEDASQIATVADAVKYVEEKVANK